MTLSTRSSLSPIRGLALAASLLLFLSACSSSGDDASNDTDDAAVTTQPSDSDSPDAGSTDADGSDSDSTDGDSGIEDDAPTDGGLSEVDATDLFTENCKAALSQFAQLESQIGSSLAGQVPDVEGAKQSLAQLVEAAPSEIKVDFKVMETELGGFLEEFGKLNLGNGQLSVEQLQKLGGLSSKIDSEALTQATDNIEAYFEANCTEK